MLTEKKLLSFEELDNQAALELPAREMMALVTIVLGDITVNITNVDIANDLTITVKNIRAAVQVCAAIAALSTNTNAEAVCEAFSQ